MKDGREVPQLVIHWPLEDNPIIFIDSIGIHDECALGDWIAEHRHELLRYFDHALDSVLERCENAAAADLGKRSHTE